MHFRIPTSAVLGLALLACAPALRPVASSVVPSPAPASGATATRAVPDPATQAPPQAPALAPGLDHAKVSLDQAISAVSAAFGLPDSALAAPRAMDGPPLPQGDADDEVSWDIDVTSYATNDRVAHYLALFSGSARARIEARLQRGRQYEPMIRARFRAAGIPEDMYYLGLVESGYDPHAYSRAAAVGMWQFMSSTARGIGLRVDWWVDERRDPARATDAAAKFIDILQKQFGSYYLAAAAYNGGPGRVSRGLTRFSEEMAAVEGDDRFFALAEQNYLKGETKNYVPQLIAAAMIGKEPGRYGLSLEDVAPYAYDSVQAPGLTPLATVAAATGTSPSIIRDLNGHLLRGATPPDQLTWVKVPTGTHADFAARLEALPESERLGFARVKTKKGQSLAAVAKAHGLSTRTLQQFNRSVRFAGKTTLVAGQTLLVPTPQVVAAARDVPDPSIERYGSAPSGATVHVVRRGESLGSIAKRYRTTVASLVRLNGLKRQVIYPGQRVVVRGRASRASTSRQPARSAKATAKAATAKAAPKTALNPGGRATSNGPAAKAPATGAARRPPATSATSQGAIPGGSKGGSRPR